MEKLMTVKELAEYLHISQQTLLIKVRKGEIPSYKIGWQWRFKREEIDTVFKKIQKENYDQDYTKLLYNTLGALSKIRMPGRVRQILDTIICNTWGKDLPVKSITHKEFQEATNLPDDRIYSLLRLLRDHNFIITNDAGYSVQVDHTKWLPFSKDSFLTKKEEEVWKTVEDTH